MAENAAAPAPMLSDAEVQERLARADAALEQVEQTPGPIAELALDAVQAVAEVYGAALARVMARAAAYPELVEALSGDEVVQHLLALHGIHPQTVEERARGALATVLPYVHSHGGEVELVGIAGGVARIRMSGSCSGCASSTATLENLVRDAVLTAAPELSGVEAVSAQPEGGVPAAGFVPLQSLRRGAAAR